MSTDETEQKQAYALALLKCPDDPYKAALTVVGGDLARALVMSRDWPQDPEVTEHQAVVLADKGEDAFLPSKAEVVRAIWKKAEGCRDPDTAFKGYKLVADIMGYVEKPGTTVNNNTLVDNRKVMIVKDHGTDEEWEAKLLAQQAALTHDGTQSTVN